MKIPFLLFAPGDAGGGGAAGAAGAGGDAGKAADAGGDKGAAGAGDAGGGGDKGAAGDGGDKGAGDGKAKIADPFAALAPKKKDDDKGAGDGKKVAIKKDPIVEQRERIKAQNDQLSAAVKEAAEWRTKAEAYEKKNGGDSAALLAKQKEMEAEVTKLRGEIAAKDYSKHPDFVKNFEQPFMDAANRGKKVIESLQVVEKDAAGEVKQRAADWEKDFAPIYKLPRGAARAMAKERFGEDAGEVMQKYDELHSFREKKEAALSEWQSGADKREQEERAQQIERTAKATEAFHAATKDMSEGRPELFQDNPDDAEENELRKQSTALVDAAYFQRDRLAPQELLVLDAAIRLRAAHFDVLEHRLTKVTAELAEYKARLDGKDASRSGAVKRVAAAEGGGDQNEGDWKSDLHKSLAV